MASATPVDPTASCLESRDADALRHVLSRVPVVELDMSVRLDVVPDREERRPLSATELVAIVDNRRMVDNLSRRA